jgi:hypothetical protein
LSLVKYGITRHACPAPRLEAHAKSKDNPLGAVLGAPTLLYWEQSDVARLNERRMRRWARKSLVRVSFGNPDFRHGGLGLLLAGYLGEEPSGEWLAHAPGAAWPEVLKAWSWFAHASGAELLGVP